MHYSPSGIVIMLHNPTQNIATQVERELIEVPNDDKQPKASCG